MNLELNISQRTAEWLEQKAETTGTDEAAVAANLLEQLAEEELGRNGSSATQRLAALDRWLASLPPRPGPPVDTSRESIYD